MNNDIMQCPDRQCIKNDDEYDPEFPCCMNNNACGTTYCETQINLGTCPRGYDDDN
jgi:hypothetical protein